MTTPPQYRPRPLGRLAALLVAAIAATAGAAHAAGDPLADRRFFANSAAGLFPADPAANDPLPTSLLELTNTARADQGLAPLKWDDALAQAAQKHAQLVLQNPQLSHQYPGEPELALRAAQAGAHFQSVAENIAMGYSVKSIEKQWMNSPPHRANLLDPRLNAVGFAVVKHGDTLYAVGDFAVSVPSLSLDQIEAAVTKLLAAKGLQPDPHREDARQTCEISHGLAGGSTPRFVQRWQSSDLTRLPPSLEEQLRSGQYKTAAVGACSSANAESGFTAYRIAVLLY